MRKFAWLPRRVTSGSLVWLGHYYEYRSLYDDYTGRPPLETLYFFYTETPKEKILRVLKESVVYNRNIWNDFTLAKEDKC